MIDGYNFSKRPKHWQPSCLIKRTQKKKLQEILTPSPSPPAAKKHHEKSFCNHSSSVCHNKKYYYFLSYPDETPPGWKLFAGKKHLLKENMAGDQIAKSVKSMKVPPTKNSKSTKDVGFYLDSAADVHMTYDRLLFSI